jgi:hypothetical protein
MVLALGLIFTVNGFALEDLTYFRVFWLDRDKHGLHGPSAVDPKKPYEASIYAHSEKEARRKLLHEDPHAVQIEINNLGRVQVP